VLLQPLVLALLPPLALLYRSLQRYYRATSRELRRLEAVARSPVYTAFSGGAARKLYSWLVLASL
jgi:ATP-binding cassette subfamily C (CFTR/MRP) protein 10